MESFKNIIDKVSIYDFLTNLLPGTVLCVILEYLVGYHILFSDNWFVLGVIFYFVGMICNRFGSICIEWFLRQIKWVTFEPYTAFVNAERKDDKITVMNTINNSYRSYLSVIVLSLMALAYKCIARHFDFFDKYSIVILLFSLCVLFFFSYKKQTKYIRDRVYIVNKKDK